MSLRECRCERGGPNYCRWGLWCLREHVLDMVWGLEMLIKLQKLQTLEYLLASLEGSIVVLQMRLPQNYVLYEVKKPIL